MFFRVSGFFHQPSLNLRYGLADGKTLDLLHTCYDTYFTVDNRRVLFSWYFTDNPTFLPNSFESPWEQSVSDMTDCDFYRKKTDGVKPDCILTAPDKPDWKLPRLIDCRERKLVDGQGRKLTWY